MRRWITAAAVAAVTLGSAGAQAQAQAPSAQTDSGVRRADRIVTRQQAIADADRRFAAMDANHDGKLSADERRAWRERHRPRAKRHEAEQTQSAFRERALSRFDRIDTNRDGTIDAREREAARLLMRARRVGRDRGAVPAAPATPQG